MKQLTFSMLVLSILLTVVEPVSAQVEDDFGPLHLNPRLTALFGTSTLAPEGRAGGGGGSSGGLTIELGQGWRRLETGALTIATGGAARSRSLALPMWAKFRVVDDATQAWFVKVGGMSAFETGGAQDATTRDLDVLVSGGLTGHLKLTRVIDVVVDATYNRGLLDHSRTRKGTDKDAGLLVFAALASP